MDDANEGKRNLSGMEKLSLQTDRNPRDLLQRFLASNPSQLGGQTSPGDEEEEEEEDVELNLGLSMGGRYGVDKTAAKKKLMRSSSINGAIPIVRDRGGDNEVAPPPVSNPILIRTSSLPAETEEEWRKRKELQTLRRMAAKRRRSEKQRNMKGEKDGVGGGGSSLGEGRRCGLPAWAASASRQALIAGSKGNYGGGGGGGLQPSGSMESVGGSSSVMSESESRPFQGSSSCSEASPKSIQSRPKAVGSSGAKGKGKNASKSGEMEEEEVEEEEEVVGKRLGRREMGLNSLEDMPGVFTQGDGPNGRRIEGILYKYGKGEEVKIMCICHGSFLSPAEFVKHAGGTDVAHPLKHIVVNSSSSLS